MITKILGRGVTSHQGTIDYLPPSSFTDEKCTSVKDWGTRGASFDTYALGCVFWEVLSLILEMLPTDQAFDH